MKTKLKKNWKIILICMLTIFSLNKCTVSCNRQGVINKHEITISKLDSIINIQNDSIKYLNLELNNERSKGLVVKDAHNLGNDYYTYTINKLNDEIKHKDAEIKKLTRQIIALQTELNEIKLEISTK
jgi:uncharacterized Zn-finger protein